MIRALVVLAAFAPVTADAACKPLVEIVERAQADHVTIKPLPPEMLADLTKLYNANPPVSDETFTATAVGELPDGSALLLFLRGGDMCGSMQLPAGAWSRLKIIIGAET